MKNHFFIKLHEIAEIYSGYAFKSSDYSENGRFILRTTNIQNNGTISKSPSVFLSNSLCSKYSKYELQQNDILFSMVGSIGKLGFVQKSILPALLNQNMWLIRTKTLNPRFVYYLLSSISHSKLQKVQGSSRSFALLSQFREIEFMERSSELQNDIVKKFDKLNEIISKKIKIQKLANEVTQSYFMSLFGDPISNPKSWDKKPLSKIISGKPKHGSGISGQKVNLDKIGIPLLKLGALTKFGLDPSQIKYYNDSEQNFKNEFLQKNDILISRSNTIDLVGHIGRFNEIPTKCITSDLMIKIRSNESILEPIFLEHYLRTSYVQGFFRRRARGTSGSMKKISNKDINEVAVLIPPIPLQKKFIDFVKNLENLKSKHKVSYKELKTSYLSLQKIIFKPELNA